MLTKLRKILRKFRKTSRNAYLSTFNTEPGISINQSGYVLTSNNDVAYAKSPDNVDTREAKKPVEVVSDILMEQPVMDLEDLDTKIKVVRRRIKVLAEQSIQTGDDQRALDFLLARKQYKKYGHLFGWKVTNQDKINELLSKYKLMQVSLSGYARNIPNEALDEIEKFASAFEKVVDEGQPHMELICDFGGPEQKKDPILLAKSPFGNWWYVLGAWDKEVEYVDDLVYHGK